LAPFAVKRSCLVGDAELQARYRKVETTRILVSSAVALRIMFDRYPKAFGKLPQRPCGVLYPKWPGRTREFLSLREACNKIIHATDIKDDLVIPDKAQNPDEEGNSKGEFSDVTRSFARQGRGALARRSGYLSPASDISTFLYGRAESHSVVTKTPRSASSASSRSNSAFSLSGSLSANLRYLAARSRLMATHLPTQNLSTKPGIVPAKK
jgi:hypothetical protein